MTNRIRPLLSKRAVAFALVIAALMTTSQVAFAQDERKQEVMLEATEVADQPRKTLGAERKAGPKNLFALEKKAESLKKLDSQIVRLRELLKITRKNDARRAEILFNLSEAYWEKSKSYNQETFMKQDECYALDDAGDEKGAAKCRTMMSDMQREAKRLREESVAIYVEIVNDYPDFENLDSVLYYLGANLQEIGKKEQALEMFKRLAAEYPDSPFIPNVLVAFGDHYFDEGDMNNALRAYEKVQAYPNSPAYGYARYKEGWSYFNQNEKEKALSTFLEVLKLAKKDKSSTAAGLLKQTRNDIVTTYAFIGSPDKAIPFFKKITDGDEWLNLAERLAVLYSDKGKPSESTALYRQLIAANKKSWKVVEYQYEIVRNFMIGKTYSEDVVKEIVNLLKLVQYADAGKFKEMDEPEYKKVREKIEEFVRGNAMQYHREAQMTKNDILYGMSYVLYQHYLDTYPNGPKTYQMTFFYGELLYRVQKWEEAARVYERVIELEPEGKYTNEAVHGLVLAYFKLVTIKEDAKDLNSSANEMLDEAMRRNDGEEVKQKPVPEPKELPDLEQRLINACKLYAKLNPKGKEIVDVKYTMARKLYEFDHLKEAIPIFIDIAYNHSSNPLAVISANLHLDSLNLLQDYDGLDKAVTEYLEKRPIKDQEFIEQLEQLGASIRFKKCTVHDDKEQWKEAALCFLSFYRSFPDSEHVDKALYNAALDFERMKDLGKAILVRRFLIRSRPDSELAPKSLFNIGANYHALAIYSEASKYYEHYSRKYPQNKEAKEALANASTFRQGLGDYQEAIADYQRYLKLYGKEDSSKAADVYFQIGKILELEGNEQGAYDHFKRYIKKYGKKGTPDQLLQAHVKLALYLDKTGKKEMNWKLLVAAQKQYARTVKVYESLSKKAKEGLTEGLDAVAQAQFMMGEELYDQMRKMKIASRNEKELIKKFNEKVAVGQKAKVIFEKVIEYGRPDWTIAALYRIGSNIENFANTVRKSPAPKRLTYDQKEIYRGILEDKAMELEIQAVDAYVQALEVAKKASWFNEYSEKAEQRLSQLRPQEYRTPSEKRVRPDNLAFGIKPAPVIKSIEDEDRLADLEGKANEENPEDGVSPEDETQTTDGDTDSESSDDSEETEATE